jgi:hypothetical protein
LDKKVDIMYKEHIIVAGQFIAVSTFCLKLAGTISPGMLKSPVSMCTSVIVHVLEVVLNEAVKHHKMVGEMHKHAIEHWLFLLGELVHRLSSQGCVCEVVGTNRLFECKHKHAEIRFSC